MNMERFEIKDIIKIFLIFIIGSVIGYCVEMIVGLVQNGHFVSRQGLLYGPFIPVYGIGMVVYYLAFKNKSENKLVSIFLISMVLGGVVEYLFSYFQEKFFGTVSWDYSNLWFNLNGRTSLLHCTYWGLAGIIFVKKVLPLINKLDKFLIKPKLQYVSAFLAIFMIFNVSISCLASQRQKERMQNLSANSEIDMLLDEYYPDYLMNRIYQNKINKVY